MADDDVAASPGGDHTTLEVMQEEIQAHLLGRGNGWPCRCPSGTWWRRRGWE